MDHDLYATRFLIMDNIFIICKSSVQKQIHTSLLLLKLLKFDQMYL